ncbi:toxin-antitoxin system YwqK family antitoxin [Simkania negevensis]|uniref:Toxin-antitoxin system YwqK family antitoxin n=1 Tax=Simkania negevensis TaxID=83561 RepID=A0ABS3AS46_9BACT|nr:toxin-antitoxin system YwqK family antitoxin [Simkania negevensis]
MKRNPLSTLNLKRLCCLCGIGGSLFFFSLVGQDKDVHLPDLPSMLDPSDLSAEQTTAPAMEIPDVDKTREVSFYSNGKIHSVTEMVRHKEPGSEAMPHGSYAAFFPDGQGKEIGQYSLGTKNGVWISAEENGNKSVGHYHLGQKAGEWKVLDKDDKVLLTEYYRNGQLNSTRTLFHPDGTVAIQQHYKDGKKHGLEEIIHSNGQKALAVEWLNGAKNGKFLLWDANGKRLVDGHYRIDVPDGQWAWKDGNGTVLHKTALKHGNGSHREYLHNLDPPVLAIERSYKNGKLDGKTTTYHANGKVELEQHFNEGKLDGDFVVYNEQGQKIQEGENEDGLPSGTWIEYFPPEQDKEEKTSEQPLRIKKKSIHQDNPNYTKVTEFSSNGEMEAEYTAKEGKPDGVITFYFPNKRVKSKGRLVNGNKEGAWEHFYEQGQRKAQELYVGGEQHGEYKEWHETKEDEAKEESDDSEPLLKTTGSLIAGKKDGLWVEHFPRGTIKSETNYAAGAMHGKQTEYWPLIPGEETQRIRAEGQYTMDKQDGKWASYYLNGNIQSEGSFVQGVQEGYAAEYYNAKKNGSAMAKRKGSYKNGRPVGKWEMFFPAGTLEQSLPFNDKGEIHGVLKTKYETDLLKQEFAFVEGKLHGVSKTYYPNEKRKSEMHYWGGHPDGSIEEYWESGKKKSNGFYRLGVPHKLWTWYSETGRKAGTSTFDNGNGMMKDFHPNGNQKSKVPLVNGRIEGKMTLWHTDGNLQAESTYVNGILEGATKTYHENGKIMRETTFSHGVPNGTAKTYYGNGNIETEKEFMQGIPNGLSKEYYANGQLKAQGKYYYGIHQDVWETYNHYGDLISRVTTSNGIPIDIELGPGAENSTFTE